MLKLFGINDRIFNSNGDKIIAPLSAIIRNEDNGDFYLDLATSLEYVEDLTEGRIIVAPTPQGEQPFRVGNVKKSKNKLTTRCWHVFFDTKNYLIEDSYVDTKDANDALDHLNSATNPASPFTTLSDVTTVGSYRCVRRSLYEAITQTYLERWGGHLVMNGFQIENRATIGQDNGVLVKYGKNIKDITADYDWSEVVTNMLPVGYDGIMLDQKYVIAETAYDLPYTKCVHFDQNIDQADYTDESGETDTAAWRAALKADLLAQAQAYIAIHQYPQVNYTLSADPEKITGLGDTVVVDDARLGVKLTTNVIAYNYDCVLKKYISIEFGNFKRTLSSLISEVTAQAAENTTQQVETVRVALGDELAEAQAKIAATLGSSYVIYDGDKILIVDSLPKETATNVIMMNNGGIAFSQNGINGTFNSAWTIDGKMNMQVVQMINGTFSMLSGGTIKLGNALNQSGVLEVYDETNALIAELNKNGLKMYGADGSYVLINNDVGFAGFDRNGVKIYWVDGQEFHMRKSAVEEEITIVGKIRMIPITLYDSNNNITSDGMGIVGVEQAS